MTSSDKMFQKLPEGEGAVPGGSLTNQITQSLQRVGGIGGGSVSGMSNAAGQFTGKDFVSGDFWEGTLQEDLGVATNRLTGRTTATAHRIIPGDNYALTQTTVELTVVNRDPFAVYFEDEVVSGRIIHSEFRVDYPGRRVLYGTADAAIASLSSGTVSLYDVGSDTGINVTVTNLTSVSIAISTMVEVTVDGPGERFIGKPLECPGTA